MLYLVATPIGNLSDISKRAIETLQSCDYIASEDTRHTLRLLNALGIKKKQVSYHEHNKEKSGQAILQDVLSGMDVCLVSDAGCPGISDPGNELVKLMYDNNQKVSVIPGPNAAISALMISPFDTSSFCFDGFPPVEQKDKQLFFERLLNEKRTCILYEAPHKLIDTVKTANKVLGGDRRAALVKEITKIYESVVFGSLEYLNSYLNENVPKGEYVILIEGAKKDDVQDDAVNEHEKTPVFLKQELKDRFDVLLNEGYPRKEAMRKLAVEFNTSRNNVYRMLLD